MILKLLKKSLSKKIPAPEDEDVENTDRQSLSEYEDFKKRLQQWEKAERQFKVLWTDDFGSLWQVIRLEFDLKDSWDEVKEWWEEEKTDDDDTDSDE